MRTLKTLAIAGLVCAAAAIPALAMDNMAPKDGMVMIMGADGKAMGMMPTGDAAKMAMDAMMKNGHEVKGAIVMMHDGKMMMMDDMKMDDGKMTSDHMMMMK